MKELKESGKKNAAAAQEVHLRLTALLDGFEEGKQIDVNAANQELQGIMTYLIVLLVRNITVLRIH